MAWVRCMIRLVRATVCAAALGLAPGAMAGEADVTAASAREAGGGWIFTVTVAHGDTGWDHYADAWRVVAPEGRVLATRTLHHPHVEEQPFTRTLSGVEVPEGVERVIVEARDSVHGWGGRALVLDLASDETRPHAAR